LGSVGMILDSFCSKYERNKLLFISLLLLDIHLKD